eukprot:GDKJ01049720.1.p1 GENE.GDKJ01049720.1~~GDKJ01049720.1.p1  ORF type:complete len:639 (+),score=92.38 GDKJ01049720.1:37-1953(+)
MKDTATTIGSTLPVYLKFEMVDYDIIIKKARGSDGPKTITRRLLSNVSGVLPPRRLLAIMGASGAGKSTLLNALSNRISPTSGSLTWNSKSFDREYARRSAFVQQEDIFFTYLKVQEHMDFQAELRLPHSIPKAQRRQTVETLIQRLGLDKCRNAPIGGVHAGLRGISGGERKRLSIASEIITNPSVLFLDEPTSGLDSYMAASVVSLMRELAHSGRTVAATIHQPSADVFAMFDWLLLLSEGRIAYHGPRDQVVAYFTSIGYPCPLDENPADYLIRVLALPHGDEERKRQVDEIVQKWNSGAGEAFGLPSPTEFEVEEEKHNLPDIIERSRSKELNAVEEHVSVLSGYANSYWSQFAVLFKRSLLNQSRNPMLTVVRIAQTLIVSLIGGLLFLRLDNNQNSIQNKSGALFFLLMNQSVTATMGVQMTFPAEKPIAAREYESGAYSIVMYYLAKITVDVPFQIVFPTFFTVIFWFMIGFNDHFVSFLAGLLSVLMVTNTCTSIGYVISALAHDASQAMMLSSVLIMPFTMFAGFTVNGKDIPDFWIWAESISFVRWGFRSLIYSVFGVQFDTLDDCPDRKRGCFETGDDVLNYYGIRLDNFHGYWKNILVMACMIIGLRAFGALLLWRKAKAAKTQNS